MMKAVGTFSDLTDRLRHEGLVQQTGHNANRPIDTALSEPVRRNKSSNVDVRWYD